jgi:putative oxidoreductase
MRSSLGDRMTGATIRFGKVDDRVRSVLGTVGVAALRVSIGLVFIWFGLLKVLDVSPVSDLVARTVYWFDPTFVVPALGIFEIVVGTLLVLNRWLRVALTLFAAQMLGTFLVFLIIPDVAFRNGNPMLLTVEGEFVVKNLVLLAAGMVVGSHVRAIGDHKRTQRNDVHGG